MPNHLRHTLLLALSAGLAACPASGPGTPTSGKSQLVGTTPADLDTTCSGDLLDFVTLDEPVDYMVLRRVDGYDEDPSSGSDLWSSGTACATATDLEACEATLDETWPSDSGWGYCGEGCSNSGLVTTLADEVALYDSTAEVAELFGDIDSAADALFLATTAEYSPHCSSVVETDTGTYRFEATLVTSDCPWTEEIQEIEVTADGTLSQLRVVSVDESDACAGRLPEGIDRCANLHGDAVGRALAHLAWLEGAAVVAFEHLAEELEGWGAPPELVRRAREAAADEVRHAEIVSALARAAGAEVPEVVVAPRQVRSLFDFALHNATEGCVRETFGVVDAAYRAQRAPTAALRGAFAVIAEDEARHAALSWELAAWVEARLTPPERSMVRQARTRAHARLTAALDQREDAVAAALGAPPARAARAMAEVLQSRLAA